MPNKNNNIRSRSCPNCGANDFTDIDLRTIKCNYCGSKFEDFELKQINIHRNFETVNFADGGTVNLPIDGYYEEVRRKSI